MRFFKSKPSAKALNEVTVIIMDKEKKENYHETFLCDLDTQRTFEFDGETYHMPKGEVTHYNPPWFRFDLKWAMFFERHKTIARFIDIFNLRGKAIYEVGFLYQKGTPNPHKYTASKFDYALEAWNVRHNTLFAKRKVAVRAKLNREQPNNIKWLAIIGAIIVVVIGIVIVIQMLGGGGHIPVTPQNVTTPTPNPLPTTPIPNFK